MFSPGVFGSFSGGWFGSVSGWFCPLFGLVVSPLPCVFLFGPFWPCFPPALFVSCVLHLSLYGRATALPEVRLHWPRPLQALHLCRRPSPVSCWESSGRRRGWKACRVPGAIVTRHTMNLAMMMVVFLPGGGAANPPTNPEPFRQSLDLFGGFVLFATLGFSFRFHVGRPLWLLLFLASFLACCLPSPLLSWVFPFLGSEMAFALEFGPGRSVLWSFVAGFPSKNKTKCCPFLFFGFRLGSSCLSLPEN